MCVSLLPAIEGGHPVRKNFLPFYRPFLGKREEKEVIKVLRRGWLTLGPEVKKFEDKIKRYTGAPYVVAVSSCTAGLHLGLIALGVSKGDEVITTPFTFAATANSILHVGAKVVFVDISPYTLNIDTEKILSVVGRRTKVILPVHFAGVPCDTKEIRAIAKKFHLKILEDAAHALGAEDRGIKIGLTGDITAFSFYATKNITTAEGGAVTTANRKWAEKIRILSLHGLSHDAWKRYLDKSFKYRSLEVVELGWKYNMSDLQAALGVIQIERIEQLWRRRKRIAEFYNRAFSGMEEIRPFNPLLPPESRCAYHLYVIKINPRALKINRDSFVQSLQKENIGVSVHFKALHLHSYYRKTFKFKRGSFPVAEETSDTVVSLPLYPSLTRKDQEDVVEAVKKIVKYYKR